MIYRRNLLLSEKEYNTLLEYYNGGLRRSEQTIYYFDTEDAFIDKTGMECTICVENGKHEAMIRSHSIEHATGHEECEDGDWSSIFHNGFTRKGLVCHGALWCDKTFLYRRETIEMTLEKNSYLGCTDYELQLRFGRYDVDCAKLLLLKVRRILRCGNLTNRISNTPIKARRFFERAKQMTVQNRPQKEINC